MTASQAEAVGLPCLVGKCDADNARRRLAAGDFNERERADLEASAATCSGEQPDPWDPKLTWPDCPGRVAYKRSDIRAALGLRTLASIGPLSDWPHGYSAGVVDTMIMIEDERKALEEEQR